MYSILKQAFEIKKNPFPWTKAISAGFCAALPALIGLSFGSLQNGLLAVIGSFTFLYMFHEPYAKRAKKLFFVMIGLALSVGLGTMLAPFPVSQALMVGVIGAAATFIFGALRIPGPAAIFFVLAFTMTSAMPVQPELAPVRAGFVLLGGLLCWIIAMSGWFFSPRNPEMNAVKRVYSALADLLGKVGTSAFADARHQAVLRIKDAEDVLLSGYISWGESLLYRRIYLLYEQANEIFLGILEIHEIDDREMLQTPQRALNNIEKAITRKQPQQLPALEGGAPAMRRLFKAIAGAESILKDKHLEQRSVRITKPALKMIFSGNMDKNAIVFISSLRYGLILTIAALIAYAFELERGYWMTLSCAAVMLGTTVLTTFHRAIQRTIGTIAGVLLAVLLLSSHPGGYVIVLTLFALTSLTELFITRNYAIAAFFFTPNAIFMAESTTNIHDITYFASARISTIIIGCVIGLIGTFLIGRRSASSRLPHLIAKTIRSQMQFIVLLFSVQGGTVAASESRESKKMHTNMTNLKLVYTTALGEIPKNKQVLEYLWPVMFTVEHLGYLLDTASRQQQRPLLSDADLAQLLLVFETMAKSAEHAQIPVAKHVPEISGFSQIRNEINALQQALQVGGQASAVQ